MRVSVSRVLLVTQGILPKPSDQCHTLSLVHCAKSCATYQCTDEEGANSSITYATATIATRYSTCLHVVKNREMRYIKKPQVVFTMQSSQGNLILENDFFAEGLTSQSKCSQTVVPAPRSRHDAPPRRHSAGEEADARAVPADTKIAATRCNGPIARRGMVALTSVETNLVDRERDLLWYSSKKSLHHFASSLISSVGDSARNQIEACLHHAHGHAYNDVIIASRVCHMSSFVPPVLKSVLFLIDIF